MLPELAGQAAPLAQAAPRRFRFLEEFTGLDDLQALLKQAIRRKEMASGSHRGCSIQARISRWPMGVRVL